MSEPSERKAMLRYEVPVDDQPHEFRLWATPVRAEVTASPDTVEFWAEGYPAADSPSSLVFWLQVFGTGQPLPASARWVATTARYSGLVWHLYEVRR